MKILHRIVLHSTACAVALLVGLASAGLRAQVAKPAKTPATADRIDFSVSLLPADPFSDGNRAGTTLKEVHPGELIRLTITGKPRPGFHTYPLTRRASEQDDVSLSQLNYSPSDVFQPLWPVSESPAEFVDTKGLGIWLEHDKPFTWEQDILVLPTAKAGPAHLRFTARVQVCDQSNCTWGDHEFDFPLAVAGEPSGPLPSDVDSRRKLQKPEPEVVSVPPELAARAPKTDGSLSESGTASAKAAPGSGGLMAFVLQGIIWGAISLLTPCVFPMIPITVSFFLKQAEKQNGWPVAMASVYCGTIIVVLTTSAVALLSFFTQVSTHPVTNYGMGALFIFFALSLFGMYEIELPHGLAQFTASREGKGGVAGTIFMALTFTIISFACVAPFLGGFGGTAAESGLSWSYRIFGGLAFSTTFAAPFFVLALFPSLLKGLPKSGSWLNSVKVVMGFLELAAALKFFRAAERVWLSEPTLFTFDFTLSLYVAIAALCGLYLLGLYRLPHDTPEESLGVMRMLFGLTFISLAIYMAPGLQKSYDKKDDKWYSQRPAGALYAWVASFLLSDAESELPWQGKLEPALAQALAKKGLVFVDFTGVTCTNCDYNESNVFIKPEVKELFRKYTLLKLYTDRVPNKFYSPEELGRFGNSTTQQKADARANQVFQGEKFNDTQLPLYVILRPLPDGGFQEVARYDEGKINDPDRFVEFLRRGLATAGS
jgi:thiol:disulfide interchange protein DsbD